MLDIQASIHRPGQWIRRWMVLWLVLCALLGCDSRHVAPVTDQGSSPATPSIGSPFFVQPVVGGALKFLALGDSYTIGQSVEPASRWPVQLAARLRSQGIDVSDPVILARTGWTSDELLAAMDQARLPPRNDLVTLLIGVNDEFRGYDPSLFAQRLVTLLQRAARLAGDRSDHVMVLAIPDWGRTPYGLSSGRNGISGEIDHFNAIVKEQTEKAGSRWVDVSETSRHVATDSSLVAGDGLHPSPRLYQKWTDIAEPTARAILAK